MGFWALLLFLAVNLILAGCQTARVEPASAQPARVKPAAVYWQTERDDIATLAAYSVVYKSWQPNNERGYNIGSVLLDTDTSTNGRLVYWGVNCNNATENQTQHGEVRLMLGYLAQLHSDRQKGIPVPDIKNLKGYTVYTSLEPCAQCSGMMTLQNVKRTVYGQSDPGYGKALERLQLDSTSLPNGYPPYPRPVTSERSTSIYRDWLEKAYAAYQEKYGSDAHITDFLKTDTAHSIFQAAYKEFTTYTLKQPVENTEFLKQAQTMVETVTPEFVPLNPDI